MSLHCNAETKRQIELLRKQLPQGVLLHGVVGVGLYTIARHIAGADCAAVIQPTDVDGAVDMSAKGIIRLSQIHELQQMARGKSTHRQVFIIDDAERMNHQAQNALLKLLEEPNYSVHFILTSHRTEGLLPTITSRVQQVAILPLSDDDSAHFIASLKVADVRKVQQLQFIADGRPAELHRLIHDEAYFERASQLVTDARQLVGGTDADKVRTVAHYQSDKVRALALLESVRELTLFSLQRTSSRELIRMLDTVVLTYERIAANGNVRLQLTRFAVGEHK